MIRQFADQLAPRPWVTPKLSRRQLLVGAALSLAAWQGIERTVASLPHKRHRDLVRAAEMAQSAQQVIAREKERLGLLQPASVDPNRTGLIGPDWSEIVTTMGDLAAKRTVTNPDLAAAMARMIDSLGLRPGTSVVLVLSGSFVGANIASIAAAEAMELRPVIISSLGASMYGANDPEFTWVDMEAAVRREGIWRAMSSLILLGGGGGLGFGLAEPSRRMLHDAAARHDAPLVTADSFAALKQEIWSHLASVAPDAQLLINVGGSDLGLGTCTDSNRLPNGLLKGQWSCRDGEPGLVVEAAARGLPVLHILNIKRLALDWGLPFDPVPLPTIGENPRVYSRLAAGGFGT